MDVYGIRLIVTAENIYPTVTTLQEHYPTPDFFPGEVPKLRDYHDQENK